MAWCTPVEMPCSFQAVTIQPARCLEFADALVEDTSTYIASGQVELAVVGGIAFSPRLRNRVEEILGWAKTIVGLCQTRYKGRKRIWTAGYLVAGAYNLVRISRLPAEASP